MYENKDIGVGLIFRCMENGGLGQTTMYGNMHSILSPDLAPRNQFTWISLVVSFTVYKPVYKLGFPLGTGYPVPGTSGTVEPEPGNWTGYPVPILKYKISNFM